MKFLSYHAIEVVQRFKVTRSSKEGRSSEPAQWKVTCEQRDAHAILQVCNQTRNVRHVPGKLNKLRMFYFRRWTVTLPSKDLFAALQGEEANQDKPLKLPRMGEELGRMARVLLKANNIITTIVTKDHIQSIESCRKLDAFQIF